MRALGAALILLGAGGLYVLRRREQMLPVLLGRALLGDLAVLRYWICVCRAPLPEILEGALGGTPGTRWLWGPLAERLGGPEGLSACWARAAAELPSPLGALLEPLGPLLPAGGERLAQAIEETREEMTRFLREEADRQASQGRITAALCLCGACLLILVLL